MTANFPEGRWRRAGATRDELLHLGAEWSAMYEDERRQVADEISAVKDSELARRLHLRRNPDEKADAGSESVVPPETTPPADPSTTPGAPPTTVPPADPDTTTPAAPDPVTVDDGSQVAEGTGVPPTPVEGDTVLGDGTGTALPPIPDDGTGTPLVAPDDSDPDAADAGTAATPVVISDDELQAALASKDTAAAYLAEHPDSRQQLLDLEADGKARKSVLDLLALSE